MKTLGEEEEERRTTPLGFFNLAKSYYNASVALRSAKVKSTHADSPVYFLYCHALELYLKAFLRAHGYSANELRGNQLGHRIARLNKKAKAAGLVLTEHDIAVLAMIGGLDAFTRFRYIRPGPVTLPEFDELDRTCKRLHASVGAGLEQAGIMVRV